MDNNKDKDSTTTAYPPLTVEQKPKPGSLDQLSTNLDLDLDPSKESETNEEQEQKQEPKQQKNDIIEWRLRLQTICDQRIGYDAYESENTTSFLFIIIITLLCGFVVWSRTTKNR